MKQKRNSNHLHLLVLTLMLTAGSSLISTAQAQTQAQIPAPAHADTHPLALGIRTNLLSWATLSPSLGIDLRWGTRWQAGIDGSIGLASASPQGGEGTYARLSSIGIEARRYFCATHHSANLPQGATHHGLYLGIGARHMHVDYKLNSKPTATGREGSVNTVGLILGYTFWLPKGFTVDLAAGGGYVHRYYNRYTWYAPQQQNRIIDTRDAGGLGLTHAEISLVYHFKLK